MVTDKVTKAHNQTKINLINKKNSVFFATILFSLRQVWTTEIPTAGVDGITLAINPEWYGKLSLEERTGLLVHEILHVALDHITRVGTRDKERWNQAADYAINYTILHSTDSQGKTLYKLPPGGLYDKNYKNMSAEQIYDLLPANPTPPSGGGGIGLDIMSPGELGDDGSVGNTPQEQEKVSDKIDSIIMRAVTQTQIAKQDFGNLPGNLQAHIDKLLNPVLPWNVILQNFMSAYNKEDFSYSRVNRRFMSDIYLPSLHSEGMAEISIYIDASGSVSDSDLSKMYAEITDIKETLKPKKMSIIAFDTQLREEFIIEDYSDMEDINITGRGGTSLGPVLDQIDERGPELALIFTDGYFSMPNNKCNATDIFWIIYDNERFTAPLGTVIHHTLDT